MSKKSSREKAGEAMACIPTQSIQPKTVTEAAKKNHQLNISVYLEQKKVDGKEVVSGSCKSYDYQEAEVKEEYHDLSKLKEGIGKLIDEFEKALKK